MAITFMRNPVVAPQYAIFGKLPRRADFVRVNATHPVAIEFDQLLATSLRWASEQPDWQDRYLAAEASEFFYVSADRRWVFFGVLQPSRDEAGRHYPLVAGAIVPFDQGAQNLSLLVLANELFFAGLRDQLSSAVDNSVEMLACRQFLEAQLALNGRSGADLDLAGQVLERHLRQTAASELAGRLSAAGGASLEATLLAFAFHGDFVRRYDSSAPRQALLLPLPDGPGEETLGLATWLTLYQAATRGHVGLDPHYLTITLQGRRYLAISPSRFTDKQLALLWGLPPAPLAVLDAGDAEAPWSRHQAYAEAAYILGRQLADPALKLDELRDIVLNLTCKF
ncbi:type VI secretion system-associated protein TagF [Jeongeupia naejangsanensis]|uniref:Type VI secretion system-associated protein TagF n=1 Tax=Jeongeupia naejangsanensis TaxID=613195 RepID=A0ABS2BJG8_9NEIS|nr:type VI secretion system-associated protein TagF [Jeongeupia naejangsanensis]MBM3115238.1 type VI secretion system-associated protein TagF [Jeongeupia naejangsanensis]